MNEEPSVLDIRFHLADARVVTFSVANAREASRILDQVSPGKFFEQRQIPIGCAGCLTAIQTSHIAQVEFLCDHVPDWTFHHNVRMIREVSAQSFREKYAHLQREDRSVTDIIHVSSEIELTNGENIYLTLEVNSDPAISPLTPLDQHVFLQQIFTSHGIYARHRDRGVILINPAHIAMLTMHPGPEAVPTGAWHACQRV